MSFLRNPFKFLYSETQTSKPTHPPQPFKSPLTQTEKYMINWYSEKPNIFAYLYLNLPQTLQQQKSQFIQQVSKCRLLNHISEEEGLRNVGNTCFMNSFIQLLFSIKKFRLKILVYGQSSSKSSSQVPINPSTDMNASYLHLQSKKVISLIQQLFWAMITPRALNPQISQTKRNIMERVVSLFESENSSEHSDHYKRYTQQDAFMYLVNMINLLTKQDPSVTDLFKFSYMKICHNHRNHKKKLCKEFNGVKRMVLQKFEGQYFLQLPYDNCGQEECTRDEKIHRNELVFLDGSPDGLIMSKHQALNGSQYLDNLWYFELSGLDQNNFGQKKNQELKLVRYCLKSKLLYWGNGKSGHYVAERKVVIKNINEESFSFSIFDDSSIVKKESRYSSLYEERGFTYEKTDVVYFKLPQMLEQVKQGLKKVNELKNDKGWFGRRNIEDSEEYLQQKVYKMLNTLVEQDKTGLAHLIKYKDRINLSDKLYQVLIWIVDRQESIKESENLHPEKKSFRRAKYHQQEKDEEQYIKDDRTSSERKYNHHLPDQTFNQPTNVHPSFKFGENPPFKAYQNQNQYLYDNNQSQKKYFRLTPGQQINLEHKKPLNPPSICCYPSTVEGFEFKNEQTDFGKQEKNRNDPPIKSIVSKHNFHPSPEHEDLFRKFQKDKIEETKKNNTKPKSFKQTQQENDQRIDIQSKQICGVCNCCVKWRKVNESESGQKGSQKRLKAGNEADWTPANGQVRCHERISEQSSERERQKGKQKNGCWPSFLSGFLRCIIGEPEDKNEKAKNRSKGVKNGTSKQVVCSLFPQTQEILEHSILPITQEIEAKKVDKLVKSSSTNSSSQAEELKGGQEKTKKQTDKQQRKDNINDNPQSEQIYEQGDKNDEKEGEVVIVKESERKNKNKQKKTEQH